MTLLSNYALGEWIPSQSNGDILYNAITNEPLFVASSQGLDFDKMLDYGRRKGGEALRKLTFHERGRMLRALATHLLSKKEQFYQLSYLTGATKIDSWVDIEGGIGNLFSNASLRRQFPDTTFMLEGDPIGLSKKGTFMGHHIMTSKEGIAIHINAFNFPVWGMLEKIAVNLLAGVPAVVKPATVTSFLTEAVFKEIIASGILPEGSLQLICGSARGIIDHVKNQDVVTFTGSASTGRMLMSNPKLIEEAVPFNMEADSLNCCVLGEDVEPNMPEFDIFVKEVVREITSKAGQKCTAIRRIIVPSDKVDAVKAALEQKLRQVKIGDPRMDGVKMGSLAGQQQRQELWDKIHALKQTQEVLIEGWDGYEVVGADTEKGAFVPPTIFYNDQPFANTAVHDIEAFGPVSTIMPYKGIEEAIELARMGKGSLVSSIVTDNPVIAQKYVLGSASMHGRILVLNNECAKESTGHGSPLPMLIHGGPGRAGGGEEMGGKRGVLHYMNRTALQGSPTMLTAIGQVYQQGAKGIKPPVHPFKLHYEALEIGHQIITDKRLITSEDINRFADLSGDHFYAHKVTTDFNGTMFDEQVAHGYFIMSLAAGLFVDGIDINPVLLNYGIDELRFTKPVYAGANIRIRFTCKEKLPNDVTENPDEPRTKIKRGIVKWLVEMLDDDVENPLVGIATILTMVKCQEQ